MQTTLLDDGDILAFKAAAAYQDEHDFGDDEPLISADLGAAQEYIVEELNRLQYQLDADRVIVCLSDDENNWRKNVLPTYKGNRKTTVRPQLLYPLKAWMKETFECRYKPWLEADDVMGILATHPTLLPGEKIIVSEDKDMLTIPGSLYNDRKDVFAQVSVEDADAFHLYQTLIGDTTDHYKGCPGVGHVWATEELLECVSWGTVVSVYVAKGLTEADALVQAQVARICRYTEFDFKEQEVKPWTPYS